MLKIPSVPRYLPGYFDQDGNPIPLGRAFQLGDVICRKFDGQLIAGKVVALNPLTVTSNMEESR